MNKYVNSLEFNSKYYYYYDLNILYEQNPSLKKLPNILKILLESNIRNIKNENELQVLINTFINRNNLNQIEVFPSRVIMNDDIGIPILLDLSLDENINPQIMFDLIVDTNDKELDSRDKERFSYLKWAEKRFKNLCIVPPSSNHTKQINFEYLCTMISSKIEEDKIFIYPETLVGPDIHTRMINALGVLGWTCEELESQASIMGSSLSINFPEILGIEIKGNLPQGVSILDATLTLISMLKEEKKENTLIEFYGKGLKNISLEDRAVLSNTIIEHNFKCAYFPVDDNSISFIEKTRGVDASLIKNYYKQQGLYGLENILVYDEDLLLDLSTIKSLALGPHANSKIIGIHEITETIDSYKMGNFVKDNDIVLALIDSYSSTSNISFLIQAALLAKNAASFGLEINSNIKRVLLLESKIEEEYLEKLDLLKYLKKLGFSISDENIELVERVELDIGKYNLNVASLTCGRQTQVKSNWVLSPALIIAYCLKGTIDFDITKEQISKGVYLSDIWPSMNEVNEYLEKIDNSVYSKTYENIFLGNDYWQNIKPENTKTYNFDENSTYIQKKEFFEISSLENIDIQDLRILALLGDEVSSKQLSASGKIPPYSPSAVYLESKGLKPDEFDTFENRRTNSEVMLRGTLWDIALKNRIVSPKEGGFTKDYQNGEIMPLYNFAMKQKEENQALIIFAGNNFGVGIPRAWAAKGLKYLGVKAIIAKSFDAKYKDALILVGILPLEFIEDDIENLALIGNELISLKSDIIKSEIKLQMEIKRDFEVRTVSLQSRLDTEKEALYYKNGGTLNYLFKHSN